MGEKHQEGQNTELLSRYPRMEIRRLFVTYLLVIKTHANMAENGNGFSGHWYNIQCNFTFGRTKRCLSDAIF